MEVVQARHRTFLHRRTVPSARRPCLMLQILRRVSQVRHDAPWSSGLPVRSRAPHRSGRAVPWHSRVEPVPESDARHFLKEQSHGKAWQPPHHLVWFRRRFPKHGSLSPGGAWSPCRKLHLRNKPPPVASTRQQRPMQVSGLYEWTSPRPLSHFPKRHDALALTLEPVIGLSSR